MSNDRFKSRYFGRKSKRYLTNSEVDDVLKGDWSLEEPRTIIQEQCTGLKDKNVKLIFEGDIVKHNKSAVANPIEWDEAQTGFVCEAWCGSQFSSGVIIGNIHENPELLEGYYERH